MFSLVISALSVILGGLFIGWIASMIFAERIAKFLTSGLAIIAIMLQLKFETQEDKMSSTGLLLGLAFLIFFLFRKKSEEIPRNG